MQEREREGVSVGVGEGMGGACVSCISLIVLSFVTVANSFFLRTRFLRYVLKSEQYLKKN